MNAAARAVAHAVSRMRLVVRLFGALQFFILSFSGLYAGCGAGACRAFGDRSQRPIRCELIADHLTRHPLGSLFRFASTLSVSSFRLLLSAGTKWTVLVDFERAQTLSTGAHCRIDRRRRCSKRRSGRASADGTLARAPR